MWQLNALAWITQGHFLTLGYEWKWLILEIQKTPIWIINLEIRGKEVTAWYIMKERSSD